MRYEIALTCGFALMLIIVATAKSALDELSDFSLRRLAGESNGGPHAAFLRQVIEHHHLFGFTLTLGIHLSIASIAILITSLSFKLHAPHFLAIAFAATLLVLILFRLVLPLLLTQRDPGQMLVRLRLPLRAVYPPLSLLAHPIYRSLRGRQGEDELEDSAGEEDDNDEGELQALLDVGEEEGIIEEDEGEMIQSIIRFSDRTVAEVMTPRPKIVAVEAGTTLEAVRDLMIESKYSRLPVYRGQIDNIEGVIYVRDLLTYWAAGETNRPALRFARPTYFVPETKPTDELLREMQKAKAQMALVIDEYGGLAGLVTLEDLIEEIVGEIEDEDEPEPHVTEADVVVEGEGSYAVRGTVEVGKVERLFEVELSDDDFTTVAGLVINQLGRLPAVGESLEFRGLRFEVAEADERRVSRVKIQRISEAPPEAEKTTDLTAAERAETRQ